jgi:hypothetical protein
MERRKMKKNKSINTDRKGENTNEITYQNKDVASKVMAEEFEGKSFAVYGIDVPKIVKVEPTNLPAIEANELRMDNLFLLEDGTYAIVDYESEYRQENILKYLGYVVRASKRLYNTSGKMPEIRMIVIYTADVERGSTSARVDTESLTFTLTEAFLSELDKDLIWKNASDKANSNMDISSEEMMQLIIYPLAFKSREDKQDAIKKVIELVKELQDERKKIFILKCLMVFSDKIIREEDARQIKEVLMMTKVERLIYEDAAKDIARNLVKDGNSVESVAKNTGLSKEIVIQLAEEIAKEKELL